MRWAAANGTWSRLDDLWWSALFRCRKLAFRKKGTEQWYISLGDEANMVISWPIMRKVHSLGLYWHFQVDVSDEAGPVYHHVVDPADWEGCRGFETTLI